jgi:hypothetical protein
MTNAGTGRPQAGHEEPAAKNGPAMAATLSAGVGALAVGAFVILNEAGIYAAPSLYGPAGGVSGRTTFAVVIWLIAWGVLHRLWKDREIEPNRVVTACLVMVGVGLLLTFPPIWGLF